MEVRSKLWIGNSSIPPFFILQKVISVNMTNYSKGQIIQSVLIINEEGPNSLLVVV